MKISGTELQQFMDTGWPKPDDDWYWEHDEFEGKPDSAVSYDTDALGGIFYQGNGEDPTDGEGYDLAAHIRKWRKTRTHDIVTCWVPKEKATEFLAAVASFGVTVKK